MTTKPLICLLLAISFSFSISEELIASVYYLRTSGKFKVVYGDKLDPDAVATATYKTEYEKEGWDYLTLQSYQGDDNKYQDHIKSYGMGFLEGVMTHQRIYPFYLNMKHFHFHDPNATVQTFEMPEITKKFVQQNLVYMKQKALAKKDQDPYWDQVYNFYKQMMGLIDGYNSMAEKDKQISYVDFQVMNAVSDVDEMVYWKNPKARPDFSKMTTEEIIDFIDTHNHCSALMKVSPDFKDVWFGHNTWTSYNKMNRIFKEYKFKTNTKVEQSKTVAFSGYPGILASIDDFYILDSDLYVTETTNSVFNKELYDVLTPESLLSWMRTLVANRLSSTGSEWAEIFSRENSGTYNNQFQILDLKKIDIDNTVISPGALTIIEQIPGLTVSDDMTEYFKKGYWPSYNSAYFPKIRDLSGYEKQIQEHPELKDVLDYTSGARANIFRRDQAKVVDIESYKKIIRYNDYLNDPLSKKNPALAIGARKDLVEEQSKKMCYGITDAKFASIKDIKGKKNKKIYIISGPTNDNVEAFNWETNTCKDNQDGKWQGEGQVKLWNFGWIEYNTVLFD